MAHEHVGMQDKLACEHAYTQGTLAFKYVRHAGMQAL